jgi:hypothetical protein
MSALPPKADIDQDGCNVRFVPKADIDISITSSVIRRETSMLGMPQLGEPLRFVLRLRHDCAGFHCVACWVVLNADEQFVIFEPGSPHVSSPTIPSAIARLPLVIVQP